MIVIVQPDIMKSQTLPIAQLVQMHVKNVLAMKLVTNVKLITLHMKTLVLHHVQVVIMDHMLIILVTFVIQLVQLVLVNITTTVLHVQLVIS